MNADERTLQIRESFLRGSVSGPLMERLAELEGGEAMYLNVKLDPDLSSMFNALQLKPSQLTAETLLLVQILRNQNAKRPEIESEKSLTVETAEAATAGIP